MSSSSNISSPQKHKGVAAAAAEPADPSATTVGKEPRKRPWVVTELVTHAIRMIEWKLVETRPLAFEARKLAATGTVTSSTLLSYTCWRRSMLLVAFPSLLYSAVGSFFENESTDLDDKTLTLFGKIVTFLPRFGGVLITLGSAGALWYWTNNNISNRWVMSGWIASLALPFIPALFPVKWTTEYNSGYEKYDEYLAKFPTFLDAQDAFYAQARVRASLYHGIALLPIIISFPLGMLRSALRIRGLMPDYSLAGWILIVTVPLYTLILLVALAMIAQIVGSALLIVAMLLFVIGPLIYLVQRKLFTDSIISETERELQRTQRIVRSTGILGLILTIVWMLTSELEGLRVVGTANAQDDLQAILSYYEFIRIGFELMGRTLISSLCFADMYLRATLANWRTEVKRRDNYENENRDENYNAMNNELLDLKYRTKFEGSFTMIRPKHYYNENDDDDDDDAENGDDNGGETGGGGLNGWPEPLPHSPHQQAPSSHRSILKSSSTRNNNNENSQRHNNINTEEGSSSTGEGGLIDGKTIVLEIQASRQPILKSGKYRTPNNKDDAAAAATNGADGKTIVLEVQLPRQPSLRPSPTKIVPNSSSNGNSQTTTQRDSTHRRQIDP